MSSFSIEQSAEQIYHPKTKEYFKEVLQSYINGSYRSAVVMLYSVVVCDLIYKLKDLKELYDDDTAKDILEKVEKAQKANPNSGDWEKVLIEEVKERTYLLEPADKISIDALRQHRHLSAHPVLNQQDLLSTPNKETVRALMRNMLEGLLTKNPVMSRKVFVTILEDLAQHKNFFPNDLSLETYIESRYLKNTNEQIINLIFKDLWGIVFNCTSKECTSNREINFRTLKILFKKYKASLLKYISENPIPFNKFKEDSQAILKRLTEFIGSNPEVYDFFEEHTKTKLKAKIKQDWSLIVRSPFLRESMEQHFDYLIKEMHIVQYGFFENMFYANHFLNADEMKLLYSWASENDCLDKYYHLLIQQFVHSSNYETANINFRDYIEPNLKHFNREHFLSLYDGINSNRQCYGRRDAKYDNNKIKKYSDLILGSDFDYKGKFPNVTFQ
jgi:hypothetical protein